MPGTSQYPRPMCSSTEKPVTWAKLPLIAVNRKSASCSQYQSEPSDVKLRKRDSLATSAAVRSRTRVSSVSRSCWSAA